MSETATSVPPAIELRNVWRSFRGRTVLEAVDLTVPQRQSLGIIGPNGGGKTVLLKVILGLIEPDRGTVRVLGRPPHAARGLIGYVPQQPGFDLDYPIRALDVVLMGRASRTRWWRRMTRRDREAAMAALHRVRAADLADRQIGKLSGGQLQRVLIARALVGEPQLLLLDEATASLDPGIEQSVHELLAELSKQATVVHVSHDIGVIARDVQSVACVNRRVHYHEAGTVTRETVEAVYGCPVDFVVHEHTHRVLEPHDQMGGS